MTARSAPARSVVNVAIPTIGTPVASVTVGAMAQEVEVKVERSVSSGPSPVAVPPLPEVPPPPPAVPLPATPVPATPARPAQSRWCRRCPNRQSPRCRRTDRLRWYLSCLRTCPRSPAPWCRPVRSCRRCRDFPGQSLRFPHRDRSRSSCRCTRPKSPRGYRARTPRRRERGEQNGGGRIGRREHGRTSVKD